jgi:hypothetical protein
MKPKLLSPEIYEIEDFISLDHQQEILSYCKKIDEAKWWNIDNKESDFFNGKTSFEKNTELFDSVYQRIENLFSSFDNIKPLSLHRHLDGHFMYPHVDWHPDRHPETPHIRYGLVLYYNDDYGDGALNYPNLGIVHKPKARSLLIHGGHILHGTTKVVGPARYFSTTFVFGTIEKPVKFNNNMFKGVEKSDGYQYF